MRWLCVACILVVMLQTEIVSGKEGAIGIIKVTKGETYIVRNGEREPSVMGTDVFQSDVLVTGEDSSLGVTFKDNTRVSLGPNSQIAVNEFVFNPKREEFSFVTKMIRGTLVYLSGMIGKLSPESVAINTPVATIGTRGTRFLVRIDEQEQSRP